MTPRRARTWAFMSRTPFDLMSDAALMEATRLAPAGRACSKFIWQKVASKTTGRSECCRVRAAQPFFLFRDNGWRRPEGVGLLPTYRGRRLGRLRARSKGTIRRLCDVVAKGVDPDLFPSQVGHVVAAIGRQFSRLECGGTAGVCDSESFPAPVGGASALAPLPLTMAGIL